MLSLLQLIYDLTNARNCEMVACVINLLLFYISLSLKIIALYSINLAELSKLRVKALFTTFVDISSIIRVPQLFL